MGGDDNPNKRTLVFVNASCCAGQVSLFDVVLNERLLAFY